MQQLLTPPARFGAEFDFIRSSELTDFLATLSGSSTFTQVAGAGGAARLTTDSSDNSQVSVQLDVAPVVFTTGKTSLAAIFGAPSDVDNSDLGIGWVTTDTDWLGDAATATELLYVGFADQGSSDGATPITLYWKNASGSDSKTFTDLVVKEGKVYFFQLDVVKDANGVAHAVVVLLEVEANGGVPNTVTDAQIGRANITYLPTGQVNLSFALQNGEAAAVTWDIDWLKFQANRYVG